MWPGGTVGSTSGCVIVHEPKGAATNKSNALLRLDIRSLAQDFRLDLANYRLTSRRNEK